MQASLLDNSYTFSFLEHQARLQQKARALVDELDLLSTLSKTGEALQLGSSTLGLMVWRDLDFVVHAPRLSVKKVFEVMNPILVNSRIIAVDYRNEQGKHNPTGEPQHERYYFVIR